MANNAISILAKKRATAQEGMWEYKNRRKKAKIKYGIGTPEYKNAYIVLNRGIKRFQWRIDAIDRNLGKLKELDKKVEEFVGISSKESKSKKGVYLARRLFYTWGLENGIRGGYLVAYTNETNRSVPSHTRMRFKRSFKTIPKNQQLWHNFLERVREKN